MESIIPQLVQALRGKKADPAISVSELFLSFVAAYKDIPTERRHHLFCSLIDKTGPEDFLFALLVLLVDKYPGRPKVLDFAAGLVTQRKVTTQLVVSFNEQRKAVTYSYTPDRGEIPKYYSRYIGPQTFAVGTPFDKGA